MNSQSETRAAVNDKTVEAAMRHALSLAAHGPVWGLNPQVGCVLLDRSGVTLAEGWHRGAGTGHAEVDAISKLPSGYTGDITAIITLEPCNHHGKTGPCVDALLEAGVTRVIYAVEDPGTRSGGGAQRLRDAGVEVTGGVLAADVAEFIHPWLSATRLNRPWITVKWAASLDGRVAADDGTSQWITGAAARLRVHEQRAASDAVAVGTGTMLSDNPSLTARGDGGELLQHQPLPVVIGETPLPADARVLQHPKPVVVTASRDLAKITEGLFARGVRRLFVEGGPTLASAFIAAGLVDEYAIYQGAVLLGGGQAAVEDIGVTTIGEARRLDVRSVEWLGGDLLIMARPEASSAEAPSAEAPSVETGADDQLNGQESA